MNYLSLVNRCILESKQTLDTLTSANFANPERTILYERFKQWVAQAYEDIVEERREWFFTNERGVVTIQPRLHLAKIDPSYTPTIGDTLVGDVSGVRFELTEIFPDHEGYDPTECTVGVRFEEEDGGNQLVQWETLTATSGVNEWLEAARIENRGTYKMEQYLPNLDSVDLNSFTVKPSVLNLDFDSIPANNMPPLRYVTWPQWLTMYDDFYATPGHPLVVSKGTDGSLYFYPTPDGLYDVTFNYSRGVAPLEQWNDIPTALPDEHHLLLVWKALIEFADFNNDRQLFARANKKYQERLGWLMRDYLPEMKFDLSRFYTYG